MIETLSKSEMEISPGPLYQMAMGFAMTKSLLAAHRLGLFASLATGSKSAEEIARERSLSRDSTERLLDACVSLHLCTKTGGLYANSPLSQRYLTPGRRGFLGGFLDHFNDHMYPAWYHLEEAVKTGQAQIQQILGEENDHFFQAIDRQPQNLETFMRTMDEHSLLEGEALAGAYDFSPHKELLDVGGGTGAMTVAILERYPSLKAILFDRPPVCEIAARNLREHGLADRVRLQRGDFFKDTLPKTADVLLLSGILHNWSPVNAQAILGRCHEAMKPGTILLISEQILSVEKPAPSLATLCSLNMLVMLGGAREYSSAEFETMLTAAGFRLVALRPTGGFRQLLVAQRI